MGKQSASQREKQAFLPASDTSPNTGSVKKPTNYRKTRISLTDYQYLDNLAAMPIVFRDMGDEYGLSRNELMILAACERMARENEGIFTRPMLEAWFVLVIDHREVFKVMARLEAFSLVERITRSNIRYKTHKYQVMVKGMGILRDYIRQVKECIEDVEEQKPSERVW